MKCVACLSGFRWECRLHGECNDDSNGDVPDGSGNNAGLAIGSFTDVAESNSADIAGDSAGTEDVELRTYKDDSALRDQQSTGRKRAAKAYPLDPEASCEWKMRKNCGGGQFPIVGCVDGLQQARHHGPDKNTLNNERGNVHRICHTCHNRWHTLNDEGYVWDAVHPLHEPYDATIADIGLNEVFWNGRKVVKAKD